MAVAEMFVDGAWTGSLSGETFTADSPATGETIGEVPSGTRDDARLAIGAANRAAEKSAREAQKLGAERVIAALTEFL